MDKLALVMSSRMITEKEISMPDWKIGVSKTFQGMLTSNSSAIQVVFDAHIEHSGMVQFSFEKIPHDKLNL